MHQQRPVTVTISRDHRIEAMLLHPTRQRRKHRVAERLGVHRHEAVTAVEGDRLRPKMLQDPGQQIARHGRVLEYPHAHPGKSTLRQETGKPGEVPPRRRVALVGNNLSQVSNRIIAQSRQNAGFVGLADLPARHVEFQSIAINGNMTARHHDRRATRRHCMIG